MAEKPTSKKMAAAPAKAAAAPATKAAAAPAAPPATAAKPAAAPAPAAKPAVAAKPATAPAPTAKSRVDATERQKLIAEAAYYRALKRGFSSGSDVQDWLAAEKEVDARIAAR
jgi:hypothetical protein